MVKLLAKVVVYYCIVSCVIKYHTYSQISIIPGEKPNQTKTRPHFLCQPSLWLRQKSKVFMGNVILILKDSSTMSTSGTRRRLPIVLAVVSFVDSNYTKVL